MVMVSSLSDRPVMTNEWSGVVENLKKVEIGHVTYQSIPNFISISKTIIKMIKQGPMRSNMVKNKILVEISHVTYQSITNFILISKFIMKMIKKGQMRSNKVI